MSDRKPFQLFFLEINSCRIVNATSTEMKETTLLTFGPVAITNRVRNGRRSINAANTPTIQKQSTLSIPTTTQSNSNIQSAANTTTQANRSPSANMNVNAPFIFGKSNINTATPNQSPGIFDKPADHTYSNPTFGTSSPRSATPRRGCTNESGMFLM